MPLMVCFGMRRTQIKHLGAGVASRNVEFLGAEGDKLLDERV